MTLVHVRKQPVHPYYTKATEELLLPSPVDYLGASSGPPSTYMTTNGFSYFSFVSAISHCILFFYVFIISYFNLLHLIKESKTNMCEWMQDLSWFLLQTDKSVRPLHPTSSQSFFWHSAITYGMSLRFYSEGNVWLSSITLYSRCMRVAVFSQS